MSKDNEVVGEVILQDVRLSFAHIFEPSADSTNKKTGETIKGSYQARFLMEKGTEQTKKNMAALKRAGAEAKTKKWGSEENWKKLKSDRVCVRDGDEEEWDGYEGSFYVAGSNRNRPTVITNRKDKDGLWIEVEPGQKNSPYSGCYVNAVVRLWVQDNEYGRRLNCSIEVVQFRRDGEAFGAGRVDANEKLTMDMVSDEVNIDDDDDDLI